MKITSQTVQAGSEPKQEKAKKLEPLKPLTKEEKIKAALTVEKQLNNDYETILLQRMNKRVGTHLPSFPTHAPSIDEDLFGCGGVPKGRIIEVFGPESSGKTSVTLDWIAEVQQAGGMAAFVDAEHALDPDYAVRIGVNLDELLISQPDYGEQALEVVEALVLARCVDLIVVDSVAALVPKAELDGDMGDSHMGLQARLMSQAMRKLRGICNVNGTTVVFINQTREKLGVMFGNPETTTGGRALKFYASTRIKIRQLSKDDGGIILDDSKNRIGQRCRLTAVKNKCGGMPYAETDINLMYSTGWDKRLNSVEYAIKIGVVQTTSPGRYAWKGAPIKKKALTEEPTFGILRMELQKAIEARRAAHESESRDAKQRAEEAEGRTASPQA